MEKQTYNGNFFNETGDRKVTRYVLNLCSGIPADDRQRNEGAIVAKLDGIKYLALQYVDGPHNAELDTLLCVISCV